MSDRLGDKRTQVLWVHSSIDDMTNLSPNAMRVYMHLVRRANGCGMAWPSLQSIGDHCFATVYQHPDTRRKHAIAALDELIAAKLIRKEEQISGKGQHSNHYFLLDPVTVASQPAVTVEAPPPVTVASHKGNPSEGNPTKSNDDDDRTRARGAVVKSYQENIGIIAPLVGEQLFDLMDEVGQLSVLAGILAAANQNKRSFAYMQKCARNHANGVDKPQGKGSDTAPQHRSANRGLAAATEYMRKKGMLDERN